MKRKKTKTQTPPNVSAKLAFSIHGKPIEVDVVVPVKAVQPETLLPVFQNITNEVVRVATELAVEKGETISCAKGCGACCAQVVPVSEAEARMISQLVNRMPEPRRQEIQNRFHAALKKIREAGLFEDLCNMGRADNDEVLRIGHAYFNLGVDCPFLEDGACSIHPQRPLKCREFLATSPAVNCRNPTRDSIRTVELPIHVSHAVAQLNQGTPGYHTKWLPLTLALWWTENHKALPGPLPGPQIFEVFYNSMFGDVSSDAK